MSKAVPHCPMTAASTALERQPPCGGEGWSMCWWSALQVEQVPSTGPLWSETMPHIPMTEKNGMPYTSAVASPTLGAAAPRRSGGSWAACSAVLRGTCVTQPSSGPGYCHLLTFIPSGSYQRYLGTWTAFSPIAAELFMELIVFQWRSCSRSFWGTCLPAKS